ncbi:hypothetical protein CERZMDRAFT_110054 [Cercospora zeae-maydis SCOH1-5]|uniref:non-specific serine/threonine protein kinase n=1 Tax=Cercospora zeae-maydis SCOH1-5 TaxID=717836 RepID=A0A6A6FPG2_9PEZI|nr:hypothetical protein CERZMDRAFT_110054 [Cercospora zeae-maydis SCOH1-5]
MSGHLWLERRLFSVARSSVRIEEETVRGYKANDYYPVQTGQTFNGQYRTVGKPGYGSASTVWLCRDLQNQAGHVVLKVYINNSEQHREPSVCRHISNVSSEHPGREHVRKLLDSFEIEGPHGKHICLGYEPLGNSLALDFLHTEAGIIHTDLQPNNIILGMHDNSILAEFERGEQQDPSPRKETDDRAIYVSRPMPLAKGWPSLSDFSEARFGNVEHTDLVMPDVYRAPEVILGMSWSFPIDIWAFAMVLWDLFEPERLFSAKNENARYSEAHHLAQMIAVLGPPSQDFLRRSSKCEKYWDEHGRWIGDVPVPDTGLIRMEKMLSSKDKADFLDFMKKVLQWRPEDRSDCNDIFFSEWPVADLIESGQIVREEA